MNSTFILERQKRADICLACDHLDFASGVCRQKQRSAAPELPDETCPLDKWNQPVTNLDRIRHMTTGAVGLIQAHTGFGKIRSETDQAICLSVCNQCKHLDSKGDCKLCGCTARVVVRVAWKSCPDVPDRWAAALPKKPDRA